MGVGITGKVGRVGLFGALLLAGSLRGSAQVSAAQVGVSAEFQDLAAHAQAVFVGQIVSIQRKDSVEEVTFRVERPVVGAAGASYVMREWAGLWPAGHNRYSVGQRVLAFLHGASGSGMSSPVHGAEGLVPVVVQGADAPELVDVRRLAASVVRAPGTPLPTEADGAVQLTDVLALIGPAGRSTAFEPIRLVLPGRGRLPVALPGRHIEPTSANSGQVQGTGIAAALAGTR